jgi:predicted aspartyl protease
MRVPFDDEDFDPPAPVIPIHIGGLNPNDPAAMLRMLVDTGADCTVVPTRLVRSLRLPLVDRVKIQGAGGEPQTANVHAARIRVGTMRAVVRVVALGNERLLGRDILNRLILHVDGPGTLLSVLPRPKRPRK